MAGKDSYRIGAPSLFILIQQPKHNSKFVDNKKILKNKLSYLERQIMDPVQGEYVSHIDQWDGDRDHHILEVAVEHGGDAEGGVIRPQGLVSAEQQSVVAGELVLDHEQGLPAKRCVMYDVLFR